MLGYFPFYINKFPERLDFLLAFYKKRPLSLRLGLISIYILNILFLLQLPSINKFSA